MYGVVMSPNEEILAFSRCIYYYDDVHLKGHVKIMEL
jgi:hypothetical protein